MHYWDIKVVMHAGDKFYFRYGVPIWIFIVGTTDKLRFLCYFNFMFRQSFIPIFSSEYFQTLAVHLNRLCPMRGSGIFSESCRPGHQRVRVSGGLLSGAARSCAGAPRLPSDVCRRPVMAAGVQWRLSVLGSDSLVLCRLLPLLSCPPGMESALTKALGT